MNALLVIHSLVAWACLGLIWTVQVVHYPLFANVGHGDFKGYHERHMRLVTRVVGPLMLAEIGSAGALLYLGERSVLFLVSLAALAVVWISTAVSQVPLHHRLVLGHDAEIIRRLVRTNWWRTLAWTIRGMCLAALLLRKI